MISKKRLKQLIKEELSRAVNVTEADDEGNLDTALSRGTMTKANQAAAALQTSKDLRSGDAGQELSMRERNMIEKIYNFVMELANQPDVDLMKARPAFETFLDKIERQLATPEDAAADADAEAAEGEPAPTDDAGADSMAADAGADMAQKIAGALGGQ